MDALISIFGSGKELTTLQMCLRAAVVFWLTLVAVRISGRRTLGSRGAFDFIVSVLLGAIVSRAVVGASPFLPTIAAAFTIVVLHRLLGFASVKWPGLDALLNGTERLLVRSGVPDPTEMRKALVTPRDLNEALRLHGHSGSQYADDMFLERSGQISLVRPERGARKG